jgi:hypothetical protein
MRPRVDQVGRLREAQLHHGQQAVAAGQQPGLVTVAAEQRDASGRLVGAWYSNGLGITLVSSHAARRTWFGRL